MKRICKFLIFMLTLCCILSFYFIIKDLIFVLKNVLVDSEIYFRIVNLFILTIIAIINILLLINIVREQD